MLRDYVHELKAWILLQEELQQENYARNEAELIPQ